MSQDDNQEQKASGNIKVKGNVSNANLNTGTQGDVTINTGNLAQSADTTRKELAELFKQLETELNALPEEDKKSAQRIKMYAEEAAEEVSKDAPDKTRLEIKGEDLKAAAQNILAVTPIVTQIAAKLLMLG